MPEMGVITVYETPPRNIAQMSDAIAALAQAIREEEFERGSLATSAFYRVPKNRSVWYSFMHFTERGWTAFGCGPKVQAAQARVDAQLCGPAHRQLLEPVIVWGSGSAIANSGPRPPGAAPETDVGAVYSMIVEPRDSHEAGRIMLRIFDEVMRHEIPTGDVRTYSLYKDMNVPGRWVMFEHFTAQGEIDHAAHPDVMKGGIEVSALMTRPYSRQVLVPLDVSGCGEPLTARRGQGAESGMEAGA